MTVRKAGEVPSFRGNEVRIHGENRSLGEAIPREGAEGGGCSGAGLWKRREGGLGRTLCGRLCQRQPGCGVAGGGLCGLAEVGNQKGKARGQ